jgi:hypothetical protein
MTMCATPVAPDKAAAAATDNLKLTVSKAIALRQLKQRIQQGVAIRRRRVRYVEDLEEARTEKAAWVQSYTETLRQMFYGTAGDALADACNNWVGRVYPEYAEMELFVEQFYDDMDYRLTRLRDIARQVSEITEPVLAPNGSMPVTLVEQRATSAGATPAGTVPAGGTPAPATAAAAAAAPATTTKWEEEEADVVADTETRMQVSGLVVAHGAAAPALESLQRFLRELGMEVLTLPAVPPEGTSAVAALERHPNAAFAVVLLGSDDAASAVTFQLGYLVGRLGLARVCTLYEHGPDCTSTAPTTTRASTASTAFR